MKDRIELPQAIVDGDVYTMGFMAGRLFEATLINEEYLDLGGWELVDKDEFIKHLGSLAVAVALMKEHGTLGQQAERAAEEGPNG